MNLGRNRALSRRRRLLTSAQLIIVAAALVVALLVGWSVFGGTPATGLLVDSVASPDGRWVASTYDIEQGGTLGVVTGRVELQDAVSHAGLTEAIYYGPGVASVRWRADNVVVITEGQSESVHVLRVPGSSYDYRTDDASNLAIGSALVIGAGILAGLAVWGGVRLWRRVGVAGRGTRE